MTKPEAEALAVAHLQAATGFDQHQYTIDSRHTIEASFGWVFFYNARAFLETGDRAYALAGNAPLIVDRTTGAVVVTGTGRSAKHYIAWYEAHGSLDGFS